MRKSSEAWRRSGSKPPRRRQVRICISRWPVPGWHAAQSASASAFIGTVRRPASGWSAGITSRTCSLTSDSRVRSAWIARGRPSYSSPTTASSCWSRSAGTASSTSRSLASTRTSGWVVASWAIAGATMRRKADWNEATRTTPAGRPALREASSASAASMPSRSVAACRTSSRPASVRRTLRPARSSSVTPASRSSTASCWEIALGV
jgi:hypothetical protein